MSRYRVVSHQVPCSYVREYRQALANSEDDQLHLAVKQYIPLSNPNPQPGDITIIGAHANGFPKELYEPFWDDLLAEAERSNFRIRSIWIADVAHQGQSYVLNEKKLGDDPGWFDHPRDLTHMINLYREEMPQPIYGIGHSMGGNNLMNVALFNPRLFAGLVLLDPVVQARTAEIVEGGPPSLAALSTFRRDVWDSREAARQGFEKSPFYKSWDTRVLDRWVDFGLRECPTFLKDTHKSPMVTLTTPPAQEVFTFLRPNYAGYGIKAKVDRRTHADLDPKNAAFPFYRSEAPRTFARLEELRPDVLYISGGASNVSNPDLDAERLKRTGSGQGGSGGVEEGRVSLITLDGIGHLIPMEAPGRTAHCAGNWLATETERWRKEEDFFRSHWDQKNLKQKQEIGEEWKSHMGGSPKRSKKQGESKI